MNSDDDAFYNVLVPAMGIAFVGFLAVVAYILL